MLNLIENDPHELDIDMDPSAYDINRINASLSRIERCRCLLFDLE